MPINLRRRRLEKCEETKNQFSEVGIGTLGEKTAHGEHINKYKNKYRSRHLLKLSLKKRTGFFLEYFGWVLQPSLLMFYRHTDVSHGDSHVT